MTRIALFVATMIFCYLCASFILVDLNPFNWSTHDRAATVLIGTMLSAFCAAFPRRKRRVT